MKIELLKTTTFVIPSIVLVVAISFGQTPSSTPSQPSQKFEMTDPVIQKIWVEGIERSQLYPLAQTLMDSIGPRSTGSIDQQRAVDWVLGSYRKWGVPVRSEQYGTWMKWNRGIGHF